jgi:hypothetical protein
MARLDSPGEAWLILPSSPCQSERNCGPWAGEPTQPNADDGLEHAMMNSRINKPHEHGFVYKHMH